ncbi:MFS transporter [Sedimenticola selenatireducens]|uniref:MFS transporter n=1 Tax=Sedimenticola selenatireducens TaxID=191960 RepID=A0A557S9J8_9GAMM|nr:MFS transporter [Sedimenticola selenatireducens]TVO74098.1 MFS transporter [Sedimenticola selenatireducens]TVT61618.1 MAG: MFS transporter [Sedimenticola selenatireducens]
MSNERLDPSLTRRHLFLCILFPFALGYYLSYLARVVNAVLAPDLITELGLEPDALGLLTASYFFTFAAAQLPLGILLDRYSPRKIEAGLLLVAAAGALLFALGDSAWDLIIGRGLIGLGVSACLMAAFKTFTLWFKPEKLPMVNGVILASGGVGAITATAPVQAALSITDWRGVFMILAGLMVVSSITIFLLVPDHTEKQKKETLKTQIKDLKAIFTDRFFWMIAPLTMLSQASFISIQSLWAGPWLQDIGGLNRPEMADTLLLAATAMVAGFLVMGTLAERLARVGVPSILLSVTGMMIFQIIQLLIILGPSDQQLSVIWIAFGFFGTTGIVQYAVLSQHYPRHLAGRVNTAMNLLVFIAIFVLQYTIGAIINLWPQASPGHYLEIAYQASFGFVLLLQAVALCWFVWEYRRQSPAHKSIRG